MATVRIEIECGDEVDVNDVFWLLFGGTDVPEAFGESVKTFGDFLLQHDIKIEKEA
jgi:hypothetical protein